jgi:hypothetical protein
MRRTLDIETTPTALRVLAHEATHIALEAPSAAPTSLADDTDVTLGAVSVAAEAACVTAGGETAGAQTMTPLAGLPMSWSELDEWLEAS